tara:strand:- start:2376 stop:2573 length:198 start_codon:yes stop_codon:yes gene_type:complete
MTKLTKEYKQAILKLLAEVDRKDLCQHVRRPTRPEDPADFLEELIAEFPVKKERKEFKIREDATF